MTTKEQERKALDKIRKIVEELGENSYIGMAFEGCFEIGEENIENDFGCSMKQRAETAEKNAEEFKKAGEYYAAEAERYQKQVEELKGKTLTTAEAGEIKAILIEAEKNASRIAEAAAREIVEHAENPNSQDFQNAVQSNRWGTKRASDCERLIKRLLETMK
ncbi:hypothetical protein EI53_01229 [Fusobacterium naviforme]|nr:hypothetical protein F7P78_06145 [Fusobacterium naviforme]PSL10167.1 hypothetical protein EI53_01229 [Fusobacterium naviforme]STO27577.1 Uncharacterised protein [Fusobacterium naviforme]